MQMQKPLILITNDDGIQAPGLRNLVKFMLPIGEVIVVAPDKPQSGMGHAITITMPLHMHKLMKTNEHSEYSCTGTPVDCVKLAIDKILHRKPDLLVSGINHGSNASINIIYSGTMSAALEGAMEGVPSIGFSLIEYAYDADFSHTEKYVQKIAANVIENGLPKEVCLNVNFPGISSEPLKGVRICRQAMAHWKEEFDQRKDPHGRDYFWLTGVFENHDEGKDTDEWALANNYVSIVPAHFDFTAHKAISQINKWNFDV
jgi:5'-nucleotidase